MTSCPHTDCTAFDPCVLSDKDRKRVVCLYPSADTVTAKQRRENRRWVKRAIKQTDKGMEKYHAEKRD